MKDLTKGNIYKTFIIFAIPLVLSGLLSTCFNVINGIIAGRFLGETGMAATGVTSDLILLISSAAWGYSTGVAIYIAVLFGAKKYKRLKDVLVSNAIAEVVVLFAVCVLLVIFKENIMDFLKVDASVRREAEIYFVIYTLGLVMVLLNNLGVCVMNALGMSSYPFKMSILCSVLHISGNIISIKFFKMGVDGLALATVLSATVVDVLYFLKIKKCFKEMGDTGKISFSFHAVKQTVSFAIPSMAQQTVMYISSFLISPLINGISTSATVAYSVVLKIYNINAGVYQNSAKTISNYEAQCIGAGKYNLIKKGFWVGFLQGIVLLTPFLLLTVVLARPVCSMFFPDNSTGEALDMAVNFCTFFMPLIIVNMVNNLFHSFFRGVKSMGNLLFLTTLGSVARLVFSFILIPKTGMNGVWTGWVLSWVAEVVVGIVIYRYGSWRKKFNLAS